MKLFGKIATYTNLVLAGMNALLGNYATALFCGSVAALLVFTGAIDDNP